MSKLLDGARELRAEWDSREARLYWWPDTVYRRRTLAERAVFARANAATWLFRHSGVLLWAAITFLGFVLLGEVAGYAAWRLLGLAREWGVVLCTAGALAGLLAWVGCWVGWLLAMFGGE